MLVAITDAEDIRVIISKLIAVWTGRSMLLQARRAFIVTVVDNQVNVIVIELIMEANLFLLITSESLGRSVGVGVI